MAFEFKKLDIEGLILITPKHYYDPRGVFFETYKKSDFYENGITEEFVQDNCSYSMKDVLRGLHYQKDPKAQSKLVRCIKGTIWDVAVDFRQDSPTYKKWVGVKLTSENDKMLFIPKGFLHAFCALTEATIHYKCTELYDPSLDAGIRWDDPSIGIRWPIQYPIVSDKDKNLPTAP